MAHSGPLFKPPDGSNIPTATAGTFQQQVPLTPKRKRFSNVTTGMDIHLQNRFNAPSEEEDDVENGHAVTSQKRQKVTRPKERIPPIIITTKLKDKENGLLIQRMKAIAQDKKCQITYTSRGFKVVCSNKSSIHTLVQGLIQIQEERKSKGEMFNFYTHELSSE
ncbi:hypothetical protein QAD02_018753 [Eretmocerus hayati]|uniref:Uncharacterized protein n=1 Tax=Eretmocerus hayati TaxID=131215 RepID=A0ACC2PJE2_9HYME|nr:hypothetical protein QAD02_018753 [Eretmocerus hayati]